MWGSFLGLAGDLWRGGQGGSYVAPARWNPDRMVAAIARGPSSPDSPILVAALVSAWMAARASRSPSVTSSPGAQAGPEQQPVPFAAAGGAQAPEDAGQPGLDVRAAVASAGGGGQCWWRWPVRGAARPGRRATGARPAAYRGASGPGTPVIRGRCPGCAVRWRGSGPAGPGAPGGRGRPGTTGATRAGGRGCARTRWRTGPAALRPQASGTAAEAGGLTPASPTREISLRLTRGEPARQSPSRRSESAVGVRLRHRRHHTE